MKTTLILLSALIIGSSIVLGAPFELSFSPSASEANGIVTGYSAWWQYTNSTDVNQWTWLGSCRLGQTNVLFDSTNLPNGVWMTATASGVTNQSYNATPILFDTNNFPVPITNVPAALPLRPQPPGFLFLRRLN